MKINSGQMGMLMAITEEINRAEQQGRPEKEIVPMAKVLLEEIKRFSDPDYESDYEEVPNAEGGMTQLKDLAELGRAVMQVLLEFHESPPVDPQHTYNVLEFLGGIMTTIWKFAEWKPPEELRGEKTTITYDKDSNPYGEDKN